MILNKGLKIKLDGFFGVAKAFFKRFALCCATRKGGNRNGIPSFGLRFENDFETS